MGNVPLLLIMTKADSQTPGLSPTDASQTQTVAADVLVAHTSGLLSQGIYPEWVSAKVSN